MSHPAHVFTTFEQFLQNHMGDTTAESSPRYYHKMLRFWTQVWNKHIEKHGNVPYIEKCNVCSGRERKEDIKKGRWKVSKEKVNFNEGY